MTTGTEIKVYAQPNTSGRRVFTYELRDLGYTIEEWAALTEQEKEIAIQKELDSEHEQPYWEFDTFI